MLKITHLTTHVKPLGGVESIVRRHMREDEANGFESQCISCFETAEPAFPLIHGLGLTWRHNIVIARQRMQSFCYPNKPGIIIYHNLWGLPFFADVDHSVRRIAVLHTKWPGFEKVFPNHRGLIDGALCISQPLVDFVQAALPELGPNRIQLIPLPIDTPLASTHSSDMTKRPLIIGLCGRIEFHAKRVDRIPGLCRLLSESHQPFRMELLGDGSARSWLQARISPDAPVVFHGQQSGKKYWDILSQWDIILFLSDFEGLPISMLEAMGAGVIPVFPNLNCGGDLYAKQVSPDLVYPPGDLTSVCDTLKRICSMPSSNVEALRQKCREMVLPHAASNYRQVFANFVTHIHQLPRISADHFAPRPFYWSDYTPFGVLRRIYHKGFFR